MSSDDFMGSSGEGPAGENFGEEERKRKLIWGSAALIGVAVLSIVTLVGFGLLSSDTESAGSGESSPKAEASEPTDDETTDSEADESDDDEDSDGAEADAGNDEAEAGGEPDAGADAGGK